MEQYTLDYAVADFAKIKSWYLLHRDQANKRLQAEINAATKDLQAIKPDASFFLLGSASFEISKAFGLALSREDAERQFKQEILTEGLQVLKTLAPSKTVRHWALTQQMKNLDETAEEIGVDISPDLAEIRRISPNLS